MTIKKSVILLALIPALSVFSNSQARDQTSSKPKDVVERITYSASSSPEAIPFEISVMDLLDKYEGELASQLSLSDRSEVLTAVKRIAWLKGLHTALLPIFTQNTICEMHEARENVLHIAEEVQEFDDAHFERMKQTSTDLIASLSDEGVRVLQEYVNTYFLGRTNISQITNFPEVVRNDPDTYLKRLDRRCSNLTKLRGKLTEERVENAYEDLLEVTTIRRVR